MNKRVVLSALISVYLLSLTFGAHLITPALAASSTTVYVNPPMSKANPGEFFIVNISISKATDLYAWGIKLSWNPDILECVDINEGPFLAEGTTAPSGTALAYAIRRKYADVGCTTLGTYPGVNGNGTLVSVTFLVKGVGECPLHLYDTTLLDSNLAEIEHTLEDSYFSTYEEVKHLHDVAIASITAFPIEAMAGEIVTIHVTVVNEGAKVETFNVTVYYDDTAIKTLAATDLAPGVSETLNFTWNTTGLGGDYVIKAEASVVEGEVDTADNTFIDAVVKVRAPGAPVAIFTCSPKAQLVGKTITFNSTESYDPDGTIVNYDWEFGDGTNGTGMLAVHSYARSRYYTVTLRVTDNERLTDTTSDIVWINPPYLAAPVIISHDIAISKITLSPTEVLAGESAYIDVTVVNKGTEAEIFDVTACYDTEEISTITSVYLGAGTSTTLTFIWNTTGVAAGTYIISGEASVVPCETDTVDNLCIYGAVTIMLNATVDIDPDTLNLKSRGKWITAYIQLPEGYEASDIDFSTILLGGDIKAKRGEVKDNVLMVKFDRSAVIGCIHDVGEIADSEITLTMRGELANEIIFEGTDTIKMIFPCDVNYDGKVDIWDLASVGKKYETSENDLGYNPHLDLNIDAVIDITDIHIVRRNYGTTV